MVTAIAQKLLNGASILGAFVATPRGFRDSGAMETTHDVKWGAGVSSGEVTIETAARENDADGWAPYAVVPFTNRATLPYSDVVRIPGNFRAFRHRITQIVTDGTVTTRIEGA